MSIRKHGFLSFMLARAIRLYPVYFVCSLVSIVFLLFYGVEKFSGNLVVGALLSSTFFGDWLAVPPFDGVVWTLEIEVKFYLYCAVFIGFFQLKNTSIFVPVILVCFLGLLGYAPGRYSGQILSGNVLANNLSFISYMLIGYVFCLFDNDEIGGRKFCAYLVFLLFFVWKFLNVIYGGNLVFFYYFLAFVLFSSCYAIRKWKFWAKSPLFFSRISYPLYAVHSTVGYVLLSYFNFQLGFRWWVSLVMVSAIVISLAYAVHRLIEIPSLYYSSLLKKG